MIRLRYRWAGKCPKHPRFNGTDPGAVKAGCALCQKLASIQRAAAQLEARLSEFEELEIAHEARHGAALDWRRTA